MMKRRDFLRNTALGLGAVAANATHVNLLANPYNMPIGLQLYTLRDDLAKDVNGTLAQVAAIGYKQVELYDNYGKDSRAMRKLLKDHGLVAPSGHYVVSQIETNWPQQIEYAKAIGLKYMVNAILQPEQRKNLDDYKHLVDVFSKAGEETKKAGIQFAYHNHNFEFQTVEGVMPYQFLLEKLDANLVQFEMDTFWVTHSGHDPVEFFNKYPGRFPLLHIKDLKAGHPPTLDFDAQPGLFAEVGKGTIDWKRIFEAAPKGGMKYFYAEQDYCEIPPLESVKISYEYLHSLTV